MNLGCSDGNCWFRHNTGQVTNGGCSCIRDKASHTGMYWAVPVVVVKIMVARAVQVALEKERASKRVAKLENRVAELTEMIIELRDNPDNDVFERFERQGKEAKS